LETEGGNVASVPTLIWIIRKNNGQLRVHPSPVVIDKTKQFKIQNLTPDDAQIDFPPNTVQDPGNNNSTCVVVAANRSSGALAVHGSCASQFYFEYAVTAGGHYAEGGSKPGGIIDP